MDRKVTIARRPKGSPTPGFDVFVDGGIHGGAETMERAQAFADALPECGFRPGAAGIMIGREWPMGKDWQPLETLPEGEGTFALRLPDGRATRGARKRDETNGRVTYGGWLDADGARLEPTHWKGD